MGNSVAVFAERGVELITDKQSTDTPFAHQRQNAEQKNGDRPQPDGILIGSYIGEIFANKRYAPQHPGKQAIGVHPDPCGIGLVVFEMAIGIEGGEPMAAGFIDKNWVNLTADLI